MTNDIVDLTKSKRLKIFVRNLNAQILRLQRLQRVLKFATASESYKESLLTHYEELIMATETMHKEVKDYKKVFVAIVNNEYKVIFKKRPNNWNLKTMPIQSGIIKVK